MATTIPRDLEYGWPMRWGRLYARHFPHHSDPMSRHVASIAAALRRLRSPMRAALSEWEPDHIARSLENTVKMLWEARAEIERLEAENKRLRRDHSILRAERAGVVWVCPACDIAGCKHYRAALNRSKDDAS